MDAGASGTRLDARDAYRFARGEQVTSNTGQPVKLSRPLDFLVVADHSDGFGFFPLLNAGAPSQWFVPYYLDIGAGDSDLTLQVLAGIGYRFSWGEVVGAWRYLAYDLPSDKAIADVNFNGPAVGAVFRW